MVQTLGGLHQFSSLSFDDLGMLWTTYHVYFNKKPSLFKPIFYDYLGGQ